MIVDKSYGRLNAIRNFAHKQNLNESLNEIFSQLERYSDKGYDVVIDQEYEPLSLLFSLWYGDEKIVDGKITYHGRFKDDSISSFFVSLPLKEKAGWVMEV
jgi:hypothetical protein